MNILRLLPAVHQLKSHTRFSELKAKGNVSEEALMEWLNEQIDVVRNQLINDELNHEALSREKLMEHIFNQLDNKIHTTTANNLQEVVNATGVVLHTNLGRARLNKQALEHINNAAANYSTLEYHVATGKRGSRHAIVEEYIKHLTGAEAAMVVNNNAAAVYLVLKAIASGKEVIVSRGELVEIGGSFRISEIMEESQAVLVDVGTTNKTHAKDYETAITDRTALLMKVHKSNFKVVGFTQEVDTYELVDMSRQYATPIYEDLGSGTLFDFQKEGIGMEPTIQEKIKSGIDILSFSGDKLLGGPQAGVIVGKKYYVDKLKEHQLARVLRVDKFTLAGLEATLKTYMKGQERNDIPTIRDIVASSESVLRKARQFMEKIEAGKTGFSCDIKPGYSKVGGGTMPDAEIDTYLVRLTHDRFSSAELAEKLRQFNVPIIARVKNEAVILDFRTVHDDEMDIIIEAFLQI
ncbi:L-seryl-tRNA(Sec) selenium transferase [Lentibacillus cibarius]|uniref:L-seryl-tRNA(Sec) selenium transferase n=1 Tax=Lentibacillus cibarius TaxID=2583219 RepID=A0A5S3QMK4_9BACI|nr:L-seryl-tRNA(Sec) selenium transferase [Lentibacillus cibarius]TMN23192.1 L-seryl-tRNA(Sec) selenium transferase [Lentibacillus cibarius]